MRAPGHPQASFAMESLMDELAYKIGMDPVEFRKKNMPDEVYHRQLDRGAARSAGEQRNPRRGGKRPLKRGMGCGVGTWGGGGNDQCKVDVTIARDGSVHVAVGTQDLGTGTRTYTRAIVAEELGLEIKDVVEQIGNSKLGGANPSGGSTTAASLSPSVKDAAIQSAHRDGRARRAAARQAEARRDRLRRRQGLGATAKRSPGNRPARRCPPAGITAHGEWSPDSAAAAFTASCFAEVEVDVETGKVRPIKMVPRPGRRLAAEPSDDGEPDQRRHDPVDGHGAVGRPRDGRAARHACSIPASAITRCRARLEMPEMMPIIDDDDKREAVIGIAEGCNIPGVGAVANAVYNATAACACANCRSRRTRF